MREEARSLVADIEAAFKDRHRPKGRLIKDEFDLKYQLEAQRVDAYIRSRLQSLDRHNSALSAFYYTNTDASLWILPYYMASIALISEDDDFLIDIVLGILSGRPCYTRENNIPLGLKMRQSARQPEVEAVCMFLKFLRSAFYDDRLEENLVAAEALWCVNPK